MDKGKGSWEYKYKRDFFIGIGILLLNLLLVYYFWQNNLVLTLALISFSVIVLLKFADRQEIIFYFTGFFLGPIFDLILVPRGVWAYINPAIYGIPLWLSPLYGLGTLMIVKIGKSLSDFFSSKQEK